MVVFIAALSCMRSRVMRCRRRPTRLAGRMNSGSDDERQQREPPLERDHGREGDASVHDVGHDRAERAGDGLLRADDVVVHAG